MPEYIFGETASVAGACDWAGQKTAQALDIRRIAKNCAHCLISGIRARNFRRGNSTTVKPKL
jgi:hypothetical protein